MWANCRYWHGILNCWLVIMKLRTHLCTYILCLPALGSRCTTVVGGAGGSMKLVLLSLLLTLPLLSRLLLILLALLIALALLKLRPTNFSSPWWLPSCLISSGLLFSCLLSSDWPIGVLWSLPVLFVRVLLFSSVSLSSLLPTVIWLWKLRATLFDWLSAANSNSSRRLVDDKSWKIRW